MTRAPLLFAALVLSLVFALPAPAQSLNPSPMTGTWMYRSQTEEVMLVLNIDGTYMARYSTYQGSEQETGKWSYNNAAITFTPVNEKPESYECGMMDQNTLVIAFQNIQSGSPLVMYLQRMDGPQQSQASQGYQNQPMVQPNQQPMVQPNQQPMVQPNTQPNTQPQVLPQYQPNTQGQNQPLPQSLPQTQSQPAFNPSMQPTQQPGQQAAIQPGQVVGKWVYKEQYGQSYLELEATGTYYFVFETREVREERSGQWILRGDTLSMTDLNQETSRLVIRSAQADRLVVSSDSGQLPGEVALMRTKAEPASMHWPDSGEYANPMSGYWGYTLNGQDWTLRLGAEGSYTAATFSGDQLVQQEGLWNFDGQYLYMMEDGKEATQFPASLLNDQEATIRIPNGGEQLVSVAMHRVQGQITITYDTTQMAEPVPGQQAQGLTPAGPWCFQMAGEVVGLILNQDNSYVLQIFSSQDQKAGFGTWSWDGATLVLKSREGDMTWSCGMALVTKDQGVLEYLDDAGRPVKTAMYRMEQTVENGETLYVVPPEMQSALLPSRSWSPSTGQ